MQKSDTLELPLRSRYYQGMIDLDYLEKGKEYKVLPDSYIIFLCTFDLFKRGYHKYSFVPKCKEVENLYLEDGTNRIFICAEGDKDDVSEEMKSFIGYMVGEAPASSLTSRIEAKVKEAIEKRLWRKEYMTYKEQMDQEYNRGMEVGIEKGSDTINSLNQMLIESGRMDDLKRATSDKEYQKKLIAEMINKKD